MNTKKSKIDLRQLGIIQNWSDNMSDAEVEERVNHFLTTTPQTDIVQNENLNSTSECIMSPLILNYKQVSIDPYERVISTLPANYWPPPLNVNN
jgi:hypothetical protein